MSFERGAWEKKTSEGARYNDIDEESNVEIINPGFSANYVEETHSGGISFCPNCGSMILNNRPCRCGYFIDQSEISKDRVDYSNKPRSDYQSDYSNKPTYRPNYSSKPKSTYRPNYSSKPKSSYSSKPKSRMSNKQYNLKNSSSFKQELIQCPYCNKWYQKQKDGSCPYCNNIKPKSKGSISEDNYKIHNDSKTITFLINLGKATLASIALILFFVLFFSLVGLIFGFIVSL